MKLVTYTWLVVIVALVVASIRWFGLAGWMALVVLTASVAMHVAGNAIGTRLRARTDEGLAIHRDREDNAVPLQLETWRSGGLSRKDRLGPVLPVSAVIGGLCGGVAGASALAWLVGSSAAGVILGGASSAVIGGIVGFLGASFVAVVRSAVREAASSAAPDAPVRRP